MSKHFEIINKGWMTFVLIHIWKIWKKGAIWSLYSIPHDVGHGIYFQDKFCSILNLNPCWLSCLCIKHIFQFYDNNALQAITNKNWELYYLQMAPQLVWHIDITIKKILESILLSTLKCVTAEETIQFFLNYLGS